MLPSLLWVAAICATLVAAATRTVVAQGQKRAPTPFVTTDNGGFSLNGSPFKFIGTNVYWLHTLNNDQDIINTFTSIKAAGILVVRVWAFNDVEVIPADGIWFQLVQNGTQMINDGPNGLQRLDAVVQIAEQLGMYVLLTLTNNWNPSDVPANTLPRNFLSNDYGGMDLYIRQFQGDLLHGRFYSEDTLINAFKNYTTQVVSRYTNSPSVFGWEIANDPRCNSTLPAGTICNTQAVTGWVATISQHVKTIDPNHLVTSGNHGFFCVGCTKLFPVVTPPKPATSPVPRAVRRFQLATSKSDFKKQRRAARKEARKLKRKSENQSPEGPMIRGRWHAPATQATRRQNDLSGPAFDGTYGIDSEDIANIPDVGFGTFQLFPDQNQYLPPDPALSPFNNSVQQGITWIQHNAQTGKAVGKPMILVSFGLVTQDNVPKFVPFDSDAASTTSTTSAASPTHTELPTPTGVTDNQRDDAYGQWLTTGIASGLQGMVQYQWGQSNLTTGNTISPVTTQTGQSPIQDQTGESPNDGYSITGPDESGAVSTLSSAVPKIASNG